MANSRIKIELLGFPLDGQVLAIKESKFGVELNETFKLNRLGSYQTKISQNNNTLEPQSYYYAQAIKLDYGFLGYDISYYVGINNMGWVDITAKDPETTFELIVKPPSINVVITNASAVIPIEIDTINFSQASNACDEVRLHVQTSVLATKIISPVVINSNTNNPFSFDFLRGSTIDLIVENAYNQQSVQRITLPAILNENNFQIGINNSPNGATVAIIPSNSDGLDIEYSLDGIIWQSYNVFNGLDIGTFTLYVRDQLGCSFTKNFEVTQFGIYTPYFYISKSNSIRFANRISWSDAANYKNDENTLGVEVDEQLAYSGCQNFKSANLITTQFKSNYQNNTVKIIKEDLSEVNVLVNKKTNNIGIKDKRDARKYDLGNGKTGIYFLSGNVYNFDTNAIIDMHSLAGNLPEWAVEGGYIVIGTTWFVIEDIFYIEDKSADVIVISNLYTGADTSEVVGSIYNDFNYEVYEFIIDMVDYLNQTIQVEINQTDPNFESVTYLSEKIDVAINFENNVEIYYWNDDNTDVFYATGIRHLINVELTKQEGVSEEESETHKTDTTAMLLSAQLYELDKFIFEPVSKEIWRKIMIALSHKNVFINGVQYVKSGNFETEGPLEKSNLYVLKATMLKTGTVYNADSATGDDFNTGSIEIPGLIQTEIGFVKY